MVYLDSAKLDTLDKAALEALSSDSPPDEERLFEWNWATALVSRAMAELGAEYSSGPKSRILAELRPFLTGGVGLPTHRLQRHGSASPWTLCAVTSFACDRVTGNCFGRKFYALWPWRLDVDAELRYLYRVLLARA